MEEGYQAGSFPIEFQEKCVLTTELRPWFAKYSYSEHDRNGILLGVGDGIKRGKMHATTNSLEDCLPTILYLLDMEIPSDCDGKIMGSLFYQDILSNKKPKMREPLEYDKIVRAGADEDYDREIRKKLSDLGYL